MEHIFAAALIVFLRVFVSSDSNIQGAFVVVPRSVQNPVHHTAQFNCTIAQGQLQWLVRFKDYSYDLFWPPALYDRTLLSRGVNVVNTTERASILFINATQQNNGTQVQCIAAMQTFLNRTEKANLTVFGPPAAPSNLSMSFLDGSHVLVSWVPPFTLQGTKTWYRTYVWDMSSNSTTSFALACEGVVTTNFCVYAYENTAVNRVCAEYRFATEAVNEAGASGQSAPLDAVLPTAPRITSDPNTRVISSRAVNKFDVVFHVQVEYCGDIPVQYWLELRNTAANASVTFGPYFFEQHGSDVEIGVKVLPNYSYSYTVTVSNVAGNSTSAPQVLYTTDVQLSTITGSDHQLNVTCFFAEGTLAMGCVVFLEKSGEVVYQRIPRVNGTAKGVIRTEFSVDCYNISVMDWEEDGSIGLLGVPNKYAIRAPGTGICSTSFPVVPLPSSVYLQSNSSTHLSPLHSPPPPSVSPSSLSLSFLSLALIILGAVLAVAALLASVFITIHCRMKAKNNKVISSIILSQTTLASSNQSPGCELETHLQPVQSDSCTYQSSHFNLTTPPSPTHHIDNLEGAVYDIISISSTKKSTNSSSSHYQALERPFTPLPSLYKRNIQLEQISSYAVLESPCTPSAGCIATGSGLNIYFELEVPPNVYDTVETDQLPPQLSPKELCESSKSDNPTLSSGGTNI